MYRGVDPHPSFDPTYVDTSKRDRMGSVAPTGRADRLARDWDQVQVDDGGCSPTRRRPHRYCSSIVTSLSHPMCATLPRLRHCGIPVSAMGP